MSLLLEAIRYENGTFYNLDLHQERMQRAIKSVFKKDKKINLKKAISIPQNLTQGLYKCRVEYKEKIISAEFSLYKRKKIKSVIYITDETISYPHKFANRDCINTHTKKLKPSEEVIFIKKGMLRDTSFSNIALYNGKEWHTPTYALLKGTKREELLRSGKIISKKIYEGDLKNYSKISFINALNDLEELSLNI